MVSKILITGVGCISAAGKNTGELIENSRKGARFIAPPVNISADLPVKYPVFEVPMKDTEIGEPLVRENASRTVRLMSAAVSEALENAGLDAVALKKYRVGVCIGTTVGCTLNNESMYREFRSGVKPKDKEISFYLNNNPALFLASSLELKGPCSTVVNACSSGTDAIGIGASWLRHGLCDIVIAGGADELSRITYLGFISLLVSSAFPCKPFDKGRNGLNLGEGSGILVMENSETCRSRKGVSMAEFKGYGTCADAYHLTKPHPEGRGLKAAIASALAMGNIERSEVGFINAHGTSTADNDRVEGKVISELFPLKPAIVSTKSYTGHTLGAAGGIEAVFTVMGLLNGKIPATAGFSVPDEDCGIVPTTENLDIQCKYALSTSLAFGGNNSAVLLGRAEK